MFCWQSGLRAQLKSIHNGKMKCNQCQWSFASSEKLKDHIDYYHCEILEKPKCDERNWSFINTYKLERHKGIIHPAKNTEEELDNNDQPEDIMRCNNCNNKKFQA